MADYQAIIPAGQQYVSSTNGDDYRRVYDDHGLEEVIANQVAAARADIGDTKSTIKDAIHAQTIGNNTQFCMLDKHLGDVEARTSNHLAAMERDLQNRIFESQKEALEAKCAILEKVGSEASATRKEICEVKETVKDSTQLILQRLYDNKLDEKNDIIADLREQNESGKYSLLFSNQLNEVKQLVNSVEQNQRFTSKVNQFWAWNVATPTQVANQG